MMLLAALTTFTSLSFFGLTGAAVPNSDGKSKETLHSSPVELGHDGGGHFKLPQLSQEVETLMGLLQRKVGVDSPAEIIGDGHT